MISDDERRDVAARLRGLDMSDIEVDGCIINSPEYAGLLLVRMLDVARDYRGGLHYFPSFFSAQSVVELFADLIDRPTCKNLTTKSADELLCSECGEHVGIAYMENADDYHARYCPGCGAMVVRTND